MARADSALTRLRMWLSGWIAPHPDQGEAWCVRCAMNGGRTMVLTADGSTAHRRLHNDSGPSGTVLILATWPPYRRDDAEESS